MRLGQTRKLQRLTREVSRANQLLEQQSFEEARDVLQEALADARKLGAESGHLHWSLAVALDNLGDLEGAFRHVQRAVECDPIAPGFRNSLEVIVQRLRETLGGEELEPASEEVPKLYRLLQEIAEADPPSHLAMARHLASHRRHAEALKLLEAVTLLAPALVDAWELKAEVARAMGDVAQAEELERALGTDVGEVPGIWMPKGEA